MKFYHSAKNLTYVLLYAVLVSCHSGTGGFKAGAAKVNITPPYGTIINGDFLPGYASEIHDSLYARAIAFANDEERFVFVVVDNMTLDVHLINDVKERIKRETGLDPSHVMVSCTHSHSTGAVIETATVQADYSYRLYVPPRIAKAAVNALNNLKPATLAWGHFDNPRHVSCRRWFMKPGFPMINPFGAEEKVWMNPPAGSKYLDRPAGPVDPQVSYIAVKSDKGEWIGILANYSTHYAGGFPGNVISADYFGEVGYQLAKKLGTGPDFAGIMSNGTSGDVNTIDFRNERNYPQGDYEKMKLIANEITDSIVKSLETAKWDNNPSIRVAYSELSVARRKPDPEILKWAVERVRKADFNTLGTADKASDDIKSSYALDIVKLDFYEPLVYQLPLQAVRIGKGVIGTIPDEVFGETGLKLKNNAGCEYYFSICLANGQFGYLPPASQFELGGYETWLCSGSLLEKDAESKIVNELTSLIRSVR